MPSWAGMTTFGRTFSATTATVREDAAEREVDRHPQAARPAGDDPRPLAVALDAAAVHAPVGRPVHLDRRLARALDVDRELLVAERGELHGGVAERDQDRVRQHHLVHAPLR